MTQKVAAVPRGFRTVTPCLTVCGAERAIEFYKACFGAEQHTRLYDAEGTRIVHAALKIGNSVVFLAEEDPGAGIFSPLTLGYSPTLLHLYVEDVNAVWSRAMAAGATAVLPLANTYWGDRFGKLADPFGHYWSVASRVERISHDELVARTAAATRAPASPGSSATLGTVVEGLTEAD